MRRSTSNNTPLLENFQLPKARKRHLSLATKQKRFVEQLNKYSYDEFSSLFTPYINTKLFGDFPDKRRRLFTSQLTFWLYLLQIYLKQSCAGVVKFSQVYFLQKNGQSNSSNNSAYCRAKARLPKPLLDKLYTSTVSLSEDIQKDFTWFGREVKVVDGTGFTLPDTKENQTHFPQSSKCQEGCGFPQVSAVGIFSLNTGILEGFEYGNKHQDEKTMWKRFWGNLKPGELVLGDRGFCSYVTLAYLKNSLQVDTLMRAHQKFKLDLSKKNRIAKDQWILKLYKSQKGYIPTGFDKVSWNEVSNEITVRIVKISEYIEGYRSKNIYLMTTLLDHKKYTKEMIEDLYMKRWGVELFFRDFKVTLGAHRLRSKSLKEVQKEFLMNCIAYNLIRILMAKAAKRRDCEIDRISFKGTVDQFVNWQPIWYQKMKISMHQKVSKFMELLVDDLVPSRPGRSEPRARKYRGRDYNKLNKPRHEMVVDYHRGKPKRKNALTIA